MFLASGIGALQCAIVHRPDGLGAVLAEHGVELLEVEELLAEVPVPLPRLPREVLPGAASAWIGDGVAMWRRAEAVHLAAIYRHHPLFAGSQVWSEGLGAAGVLVLGDGRVLIGAPLGAAVRRLAARLFACAGVTEVILTRARVAMVERGVFVAPPGAPSVTLRPVAHGVEASVAETLDAALGGRLIDAGADVLPLAPGVVIAPEPDRRLRRAGIAVISVRGVSPRSACCAVLRPLPAPERRCE